MQDLQKSNKTERQNPNDLIKRQAESSQNDTKVLIINNTKRVKNLDLDFRCFTDNFMFKYDRQIFFDSS